jgi:sugar phosphate isomerase/epimerase
MERIKVESLTKTEAKTQAAANPIQRRQFLKQTATGIAAVAFWTAGATPLEADPLGLPIGVQLYAVKDELHENFFATLKQVALIGYKEVETYEFGDKSASEWRQAFDRLGMHCPSAHCIQMDDAEDKLKRTIDFCAELGVQYAICASPRLKDPSRLHAAGGSGAAIHDLMTLDDWKWNAERLNQIGAITKKSALQLGYHNHNWEFTDFDGVRAYDELMRLTDPKLVTFEMDCGWVAAAGHQPVRYLQKYPSRIQLLHIKDQKAGYKGTTGKDPGPTTEVGHGTIDWKRLFTAAKQADVKHYFVEQEPPYNEMPPLDALRVSYNFLHDLKV